LKKPPETTLAVFSRPNATASVTCKVGSE